MLQYVLLPLFIGLAIPFFIAIGIAKIIKNRQNGDANGKTPLNERWGSVCKYISLALAGLHFLLFWSLQTMLMGETVNGVTGLYADDIKEIEELLSYSFLSNLGMLVSLIVCIRISKYEKENRDNYREIYFEKQQNAEYKANWCIIAFVISVLGYLWNLMSYGQYS